MTERASGCSIDLVKRLAVKKATPPIFYSLKSGEILYPLESRTLEIGDAKNGVSQVSITTTFIFFYIYAVLNRKWPTNWNPVPSN